MSDSSLEAKICVLGAQGVGKTSLVQRFVKGTFTPPTTLSTVGASFLTKRTTDIDSGTAVRLQIWDTAGQERFRSMSKLYYRGASAVILVYSIIDEQSFNEMGGWLQEIRQNLGDDMIVHVVGTKSDIVAEEPSHRQISFERCIAYVAENLFPSKISTPPPSAGGAEIVNASADSKRNSGFWGMDVGWDVCHEVSSSSGEGIDEVFRIVTRKLVERKHNGAEEYLASRPLPSSNSDSVESYNDKRGADIGGSFQVGHNDSRRRSWLGGIGSIVSEEEYVVRSTTSRKEKGGSCC